MGKKPVRDGGKKAKQQQQQKQPQPKPKPPKTLFLINIIAKQQLYFLWGSYTDKWAEFKNLVCCDQEGKKKILILGVCC